jgi:hypothetical protein
VRGETKTVAGREMKQGSRQRARQSAQESEQDRGAHIFWWMDFHKDGCWKSPSLRLFVCTCRTRHTNSPCGPSAPRLSRPSAERERGERQRLAVCFHLGWRSVPIKPPCGWLKNGKAVHPHQPGAFKIGPLASRDNGGRNGVLNSGTLP